MLVYNQAFFSHTTVLQIKLVSYRQVLRFLKETHARQCIHPQSSLGTSSIYPKWSVGYMVVLIVLEERPKRYSLILSKTHVS